jgi:hypothetical protein
MLGQQNQKLKGLNRDRKILQAVEEYRALDQRQVQALFFRNMEYGRRKSQERLLKLHLRGKLNRSRKGDEPFIYYLDEKPGLLEHLVGVNWFRIWLQVTMPSWDRLHSWQYEQSYKILRADGFAAIKNTMSGTFAFNFLEMDRGTNTFDKVEKYNKLYESEQYAGAWWVRLTERFPTVQVVTVMESRKKLIQSKIEAENTNGLEFRVHLLDELREEVMGKCLGTNTTGRTG